MRLKCRRGVQQALHCKLLHSFVGLTSNGGRSSCFISSRYLFVLFCSVDSPYLVYSQIPVFVTRGYISFHRMTHMSASYHSHMRPEDLSHIIYLIEKGDSETESKLSGANMDVSTMGVSKIIQMLNDRQISALRFLNWLHKTYSSYRPSPATYNLLIDNFGRLEDYDSMFQLLKELTIKRLCLTEKAFAFLTVHKSDTSRITNAVKRVMETLNRVGGSCRSSGIYYLIKMLCALTRFSLAVSVMEETARTTSYYNVLMAAKCKNANFQEASGLFQEMKSYGCDPNILTYNCLLGCLCKRDMFAECCELLEKMEEMGYYPDAITFEIVAVHACRFGRLDFAIEVLYHMISVGIKPRLTMHAAFIKGYFQSGRTQDAHTYVLEMNRRDRWSANMNYTLLAKLLHRSGNVVEASKILMEMMEKNLKPNFPVYIKVLKDLHRSCMGSLEADLKTRFLKLSNGSGL